MRKRTVIITALVALAIAVSTGVWMNSRFGVMPSYQGKTAHQWLRDLANTNSLAAYVAFFEMGPDALPVVLDAAERKNRSVYRFYERYYPKLPVFIQRHLTPPLTDYSLIQAAVRTVLKQSDEQRLDAFPQILKLLMDKTNAVAEKVFSVCADRVNEYYGISKKYIPFLIEALDAKSPAIRRRSIEALRLIGNRDSSAILGLKYALDDPDFDIRMCAACSLWKMNRDTNAVSHVLRNVLKTNSMGYVAFAWIWPSINSDHWDRVVDEERPYINGLMAAFRNDPKIELTWRTAIAPWSSGLTARFRTNTTHAAHPN